MVKVACFLSLFFFSSLAQSSSLQNYWVFYQPQQRDLNLNDDNWEVMLGALKKQAIAGIVFQWSTTTEDALQNAKQLAQLDKVFKVAEQLNIKVIIGLYYDPAFFNRIKQPANTLKYYLNKQSALSINVANHWQNNWSSEIFSGWYIPQEVDDYHWRDTAHRKLLIKYIQDIQTQLAQLAVVKPIYISAYLGGFQSENTTAKLLKDINLQGKVEVWLQDGIGTDALTKEQRSGYFSTLLSCSPNGKIGVVYESFREQKQSDNFLAFPATAEEWQQQMQTMKAYCQTKKIVFSLRYLPIAQGFLNY